LVGGLWAEVVTCCRRREIVRRHQPLIPLIGNSGVASDDPRALLPSSGISDAIDGEPAQEFPEAGTAHPESAVAGRC